jgi:CubicO group peptidase (beta-lactamase class C family)
LVDTAEQVDADTVFQLASLSKPVGATVVSRAVSDGAVAWDDPVRKYLPWFRMGSYYVSKNVTIGDLYAHRSGLPLHGGDHLEDLGFNRKQILRRLRFLPTGPFRDQYAYTNFGLTAAGEAVAKAHETGWAQLSEDLLYQPAGMASTSSRYADYLSAANRAVTHQRHSGAWVPGPPRDPDPESPAGGVSSTANDMARWMQLHLGNGTLDGIELIKADVIQVMRQPHSISKAATEPQARSSMYGFGLGMSVDGTGHVRWSHSGAFLLGAATNVVFVPAGDIAITVLTNDEPHGIPEAISAQFVDVLETGEVQRDWLSLYEMAFDALYVNPSKLAGKNPPVNPVLPEAFGNYAGTYRNQYYGQARITVVGNHLVMALGPEPNYFRLRHWDGNVFSYFPRGENALGITAVTFDPEVRTLTVENLDEDGLGTFNKARLHLRRQRSANTDLNSRTQRGLSKLSNKGANTR